jgi:hypothetical protein
VKNIYDSLQNKTYNSSIAIQNTDLSASANVTITYTNIWPGQQGTSSHSGIVIPAGSSAFVDMQNEVGQWTIFFGPARVTSDQNVAVIANMNAAGSLLVYRGFTDADAGTTLIVTQAVANIYDPLQGLNYGTAIEGMTVDGSSTSVTATYTNLLGGGTKVCVLPSGSTFRLDQRPAFWDPNCKPPVDGSNRFFGTVTFSAAVPIVALVNMQSDFSVSKGIRASTARAFVSSGGVTTAFAPLLMRDYLDAGTGVTWGTALEGRFLSGTGTVTITYYLYGGGTYTDTYTAGADQIFRFDQRFNNVQTGFILPSGSIASAKLTASNPFAFTVNSQGAGSTLGDALGVYSSR